MLVLGVVLAPIAACTDLAYVLAAVKGAWSAPAARTVCYWHW